MAIRLAFDLALHIDMSEYVSRRDITSETQSFVERCFGLHILLISKCYIRARSCKSETDGLVVS
jgi:hypothetical protein